MNNGYKHWHLALILSCILIGMATSADAEELENFQVDTDVQIQGVMNITAIHDGPSWVIFRVKNFTSNNTFFDDVCRNQFGDVLIRLISDTSVNISTRLQGTLPFTSGFSGVGINPPQPVTVFGVFSTSGDKNCVITVEKAPYVVIVGSGGSTTPPPPGNPPPSPPGNREPTVDLSMSPLNPQLGQPITFTATASDPDRDSLTYNWFLNGQRQPADNSVVEASISSPGTYTVRVEVEDGRGGDDSDTIRFTIGSSGGKNRDPTVSLSISPDNPVEGERIEFKANASDPDGDPLTYRWFLNGDESTVNDRSVVWEQPRAGNHTIRVLVSDGRGGTAERTRSFTVTDGRQSSPEPPVGNRDPEIIGEIEMSSDSPVLDERITFSIKATDPDQDSLTYSWYLDDERQSATGSSFSWTAIEGNDHEVRVEVSDGKGGSANASLSFFVACPITIGSANSRPQQFDLCSTAESNFELELIMEPTQPTQDTTVAFTAIATRKDGKAANVEFVWTINNLDGSTLQGFFCNRREGTSETRDICTMSSGYFSANSDHTFSVTAFLGLESISKSVSFKVRGNSDPSVSAFNHRPKEPTADTLVTLEVFAEDSDGDDLSYEWFINGEKQNNSEWYYDWKNPNHIDGEVVVEVTVTDGQGGQSLHKKTLMIEGPVARVLELGALVQIVRKVNPGQPSRYVLYDGDRIILKNRGAFIDIEWFDGQVKGRAYVPKNSDTGEGEFTIGSDRLSSGWPLDTIDEGVKHIEKQLFDMAKDKPVAWIIKKVGVTILKKGFDAILFTLEGIAGPSKAGTPDFVMVNLQSEIFIKPIPGGGLNFYTLDGNPTLYYDEGKSEMTLFAGEQTTIQGGKVSPSSPFDPNQIDMEGEELQGSLPPLVPDDSEMSSSGSLEEALDTNSSGILEQSEVQKAIQYWILSEIVPGSGETISDAKMRQIIQMWILGTPVGQNGKAQALMSSTQLSVSGLRMSSPRPLQRQIQLNAYNISSVQIQVFNLQGRLLIQEHNGGREVRFDLLDSQARALPNGIYLYIVTARGFDGQTWRSEVKKLVVLR